MLNPELVHIVHEQKIRELEAEIEHSRLARENWQVTYRQNHPDFSLLAQIRQWLSQKLSRPVPQTAGCAEEPQLCADCA